MDETMSTLGSPPPLIRLTVKNKFRNEILFKNSLGGANNFKSTVLTEVHYINKKKTLTLYLDTFSAISRSFLERRGPSSSLAVSPLSFASCRSLKTDRVFFPDTDKAKARVEDE